MSDVLFHEASSSNTIATSEVSQNIDIHVNGTNINEDDILAEMQYHPADNQREAMIQAAESLIIKQLLIDRAHQLIPQILEQDQEQAIENLLQQEVATPDADESACLRYYEQNRDSFKTSPILEVRHILLAAAPDDYDLRDELKPLAQQLIKQLQENPASFSQLCRQHSQCPSSEHNGNLGQISKGQTVTEFEDVLMRAPVGLLDSPVESRYGFHVVMIDNKVDGKQLTFEMVKPKIKEYLDERVSRKATAQYLQTLIQDADIQGFEFDISGSPLLQ